MHEASITESMLEIVLRHSGGAKVLSVQVAIGELSTYVDESIELYWQELTRGGPAEGARLEFRREPGLLHCMECQTQFSVHSADFQCPNCGSRAAVPAGGQDCFVESIEIEEAQH